MGNSGTARPCRGGESRSGSRSRELFEGREQRAQILGQGRLPFAPCMVERVQQRKAAGMEGLTLKAPQCPLHRSR